MSTPSTATSSAATPVYEIRRQKRRRFPWVRGFLVTVVVAIGLMFEPHCFRFAVNWLVRAEAWRSGIAVHLQSVEGSLFEPVRLVNSIWIYESDNGPVTRVEIKEVEADLSWRALFSRASAPWFRALRLDGVSGKVHLPIDAPARDLSPAPIFRLPRPQGSWLHTPERIEVRDVDFIFESDGDYVRLQNARFTISEIEAGEVVAGQLVIKQPWLNRTFRNVKGTTKLENARTELAAVTLEPDVVIQNLSVELADIARGRLNLIMQVAAFGGDLRIETQTLPSGRQLSFEATTTFSQIAIGRLATFLGQSDAAGGTIKSGKFIFRGSPQSPARATATLRIEATNFQWDSRQWDSLVLGASLLNGRVQIPELRLFQGHNFLNLRGDFALPAPQQQWWENEFSFDVNAKIENLTELSALILPEFKYAAGKATIDGSVRGQQQQFHGQIIVSGSDLTWRSAPIDELHATLKLNGNELQLTNLSLFNDGDYVRGRGVVNILGDKQYWGELRASVDELGHYSALLQKPIVPEPIAGGGVIEWSGEGSAKGHTGKFFGHLRKLRSLGASSALLHPINADLEGTYQPGAVIFSRFGLSDDSSSFSAHVSVGNKALVLQGIRFGTASEVQLEGDAVLPFDVWQNWPNTNLGEILADQMPVKVHLTAKGFDLHSASQLTGWNFPIAGLVTGNLTLDGMLGALQGEGRAKLEKAALPLGWSGVLLREAAAEVTVAGSKLNFAAFHGKLSGGEIAVTGAIDATNYRDPQLALAITSARFETALYPALGRGGVELGIITGLKLNVAGPTSAAAITGEVAPLSLRAPLPLEVAPLLRSRETPPLPALISAPAGPWTAWQLDLACASAAPLALGSGTAALDTRLSGSVANPVLTGRITGSAVPAKLGALPVSLETLTLEFPPGRAVDPWVSVEVAGEFLGERFSVGTFGPLSRRLRDSANTSALLLPLLFAELDGQPTVPIAIVSAAPVAQAAAIAIYPWSSGDAAPATAGSVE